MKNYIYCFLVLNLLALVLMSEHLNAQDIKIPLKAKVGDRGVLGFLGPSVGMADLRDYKGLDTSLYVSWDLILHDFNATQSSYESFGIGFINDKNTVGFDGNDRVDSKYIYKGKLPKNSVTSFVGIDKNNNFHMSIDANNNRDFNDDTWYKISGKKQLNDSITLQFNTNILFNYFDGKKIQEEYFKTKISYNAYPNGTISTIDNKSVYQSPPRRLIPISLYSLSYKEGHAEYKNEQYTFHVTDRFYNIYPARPYKLLVTPSPNDGKSNRFHDSKSNELVRVGSGLFKMPESVKDTLLLTYVKEAE